MMRRFPTLYRESSQCLYDRSTLQLIKWLETYEDYWRTLNRENTIERRRLIGVIHKAFRRRHTVPGYIQLSLFGEAKSILTQQSTSYLTRWVDKYNEAMTRRRLLPVLQLEQRVLLYYHPCAEEITGTRDALAQDHEGGMLGSDRGDRDGSSDLLPP